jgi:rhodanese-related sulfurtransferase
MTHPRLSAQEARALMLEQGYVYLDVRTEEEFGQGHPEGAYNIPVRLRTAQGMVENPRFVEVASAAFAKDAKLIVGCGSGPRSLTAAGKLLEAGFGDVVEQRAGFSGQRDAFGRVVEPGWQAAGLPCAVEPEPGRAYRALAGSG